MEEKFSLNLTDEEVHVVLCALAQLCCFKDFESTHAILNSLIYRLAFAAF